jgi:hypothetical protein
VICFNDRPRASRPFFLLFLALALALLTVYAVNPAAVLIALVIFASLVSAAIIAAIERDWLVLAVILLDFLLAVFLITVAWRH